MLALSWRGHFKRNCLEKKKKHLEYNNNHEIANILCGYDSVEVLLLIEKVSKNEWIMDSSCTFHMTPWSNLFVNIRHINRGKVLMDSDESCDVIGIGTIKFKMLDGFIKVLDNVRFVPNLRRNLIF